jgi:hypothetical protein
MKTFYAINLNGKYWGMSRWSLYEIKDGEMTVLWAERTDKKDKHGFDVYEKIPGMVFYPRRDGAPDKYPAFHFVVRGSGMNHLDDLCDTLAQHYKENVKIHHLHGHYPSQYFMEYYNRELTRV